MQNTEYQKYSVFCALMMLYKSFILHQSADPSFRLSLFLQRIHIRTGNAHKIVGSPATADNTRIKSK